MAPTFLRWASNVVICFGLFIAAVAAFDYFVIAPELGKMVAMVAGLAVFAVGAFLIRPKSDEKV